MKFGIFAYRSFLNALCLDTLFLFELHHGLGCDRSGSLLQDSKYSSLCYTVVPSCLSILYIVKVKIAQSCLTLATPRTRVGSLSLLQGIFPTQGSNPGLLHCRQILYQLSHKGSPRTLEWVAYLFSSVSFQPGN